MELQDHKYSHGLEVGMYLRVEIPPRSVWARVRKVTEEAPNPLGQHHRSIQSLKAVGNCATRDRIAASIAVGLLIMGHKSWAVDASHLDLPPY